MYSAYKLNKPDDNQSWCARFPIWNWSIVPFPVLLLLDLHTDFSGDRSGGLVFPSLSEFSSLFWSSVKVFDIVNKAEADVFLELSCFFYDPTDIGNLISGSSTFSKSSLNIWKFMVHALLKPDLENFEHYFTSMWDECNCVIIWTFFGIAFLWDWNENWPFPVLWPLLSFPNCWHIECSTFIASSFRIENSSTGIPSPSLTLLIAMLPKALLTSHSRMHGSSWVITPSWLSGSWRSFWYSFLCILATSS